jgi:YidC/Oxa1 family membrane protein insertase
MRILDSWKNWRRYRKLGDEWKKIVFYSESGQDWHYFEPLVGELLERHAERVCYVTSDSQDPGLRLQHDNYVALCIPEGLFLIIHFQVQKAGLVVLTMMDLDNLQLKKSIYPVHYVYLFHSMGSTHMVDHANSYDAYHSLFCVGPHHVAELRKREELAGLQPRNLFAYGHPRLEQLIREGAGQGRTGPADAPLTALVAPTWGDDSILNRCGGRLVEILLAAGFEVILRPHYQTRRLTPDVIDGIVHAHGSHPRFRMIEQMGETESLFRSDFLVCDWSAMAIEYALALQKPVLFIDLPRRVRNPDWRQLGIEPFEVSIREKIGRVIPPEDLEGIPAAVTELVSAPQSFARQIDELRKTAVFNLGDSVARGAAEIARLAGEQSRITAGPESRGTP